MTHAAPLSLEDRYLIRELQARYSWAVATCDVDAFAQLFAPDARVVDVGREFPRGPEGARAFLLDWANRPGSAGRQHWMQHRLLEGDGERCVVRSFVMVPHRNPIGTASTLIGFVGQSRDVLVKLDGAWHFQERIIEHWRGEVLDGFPAYRDLAGSGATS
jgi:hypothetical protein